MQEREKSELERKANEWNKPTEGVIVRRTAPVDVAAAPANDQSFPNPPVATNLNFRNNPKPAPAPTQAPAIISRPEEK